MRKSNIFIALLAAQIVLFGLLFFHAAYTRQAEAPLITEKRTIMRNLAITDLCLFTEANYTRHLSQADMHAPFQDHPFSLDHFPSGALVEPVPFKRSQNVEMD